MSELSFADYAAIQVGALLTLGIVSFLYKDNPFYKVCESIFVGLSAGYWFVVLFWENMVPKLYENVKYAFLHPTTETGAMSVEWLYLGALILGILMLLRLVPKLGWLSRWPLVVRRGRHGRALLHHVSAVQCAPAAAGHAVADLSASPTSPPASAPPAR